VVLFSPDKFAFFCVINYPNRDDFNKCMADIPPEFVNPITVPSATPSLFVGDEDEDD